MLIVSDWIEHSIGGGKYTTYRRMVVSGCSTAYNPVAEVSNHGVDGGWYWEVIRLTGTGSTIDADNDFISTKEEAIRIADEHLIKAGWTFLDKKLNIMV
jgi:hypothetical protein